MELIHESHLFYGKAVSFLRTIEIIAQLEIVRKWKLFVVAGRGYWKLYLLTGVSFYLIYGMLWFGLTVDICLVLVWNIFVNLGEIVQYWSGNHILN